MGCDLYGSDECAIAREISIHAPQWGATRIDERRILLRVNFNPRTPVGCDPTLSGCGLFHVISIHAPQWGATFVTRRTSDRVNFNPRTPVGCDWPQQQSLRLPPRFQSTHPSGVRPDNQGNDLNAVKFQSTHPSGVRRASDDKPLYPMVISIHAPQWGATKFVTRRTSDRVNFNPRTPVGCDRPIRVCFRGGRYFNPRTPVGCDSATSSRWQTTNNFNPRTPVGCDEGGAGTVGEGGKFQSTHPSGVRPSHIRFPHLPESISIHAPQWGATEAAEAFLFMPEIFQSTHPSGVRLNYPGSANGNVVISIHAPQWGATPRVIARMRRPCHFNPRTPVGCDCSSPGSRSGQSHFNPRTPVGCDQHQNGHAYMRPDISIHAVF